MSRIFIVPSLVIGSLIVLSSTSAYAFQIMKGKWEVTVEMQNPMSTQPLVETTIECIEEADFDPVKELTDEGECTILDKKETDNSLSWTMECRGDDMPAMQGEGSFTTDGKTASGEMKMTMSFNGQNMEMGNRWEGRFISKECD